MKTRTLGVLVVVVVVLAVGAFVLRGEGGHTLTDWFMGLHGR